MRKDGLIERVISSVVVVVVVFVLFFVVVAPAAWLPSVSKVRASVC